MRSRASRSREIIIILISERPIRATPLLLLCRLRSTRDRTATHFPRLIKVIILIGELKRGSERERKRENRERGGGHPIAGISRQFARMGSIWISISRTLTSADVWVAAATQSRRMKFPLDERSCVIPRVPAYPWHRGQSDFKFHWFARYRGEKESRREGESECDALTHFDGASDDIAQLRVGLAQATLHAARPRNYCGRLSTTECCDARKPNPVAIAPARGARLAAAGGGLRSVVRVDDWPADFSFCSGTVRPMTGKAFYTRKV